jgi:hypothetical protein
MGKHLGFYAAAPPVMNKKVLQHFNQLSLPLIFF